jgi:flagellar assembly protein FliH
MRKVWTRFELKALDLPGSHKQKERAAFVQATPSHEEVSTFTPFDATQEENLEKREAEELLRQAQKKALCLEREAYSKGFAQGEKDGLELGEKKAEKIMENMESLLNELGSLRKHLILDYEKEILELVFAIAEKIVHHQIRTNPEILKETVLEALKTAPDKSRACVKVNPEDFAYIEKLKPQMFSAVKGLKSLMVTPDPAVSRGGCVLETACGSVDAGIEIQLEKIRQCLEQTYKEQSDE